MKMIEFNEKEIKKIEKDKIFKKEAGKHKIWIKPVKQSKYKQGDMQSHEKYFKILKKYLRNSCPIIKSKKIKINNRNYLIVYSNHVEGKLISYKELSKYLKLKINRNLRKGIQKLLIKGYVLDFYGRGNFVLDKDKKIYYIDVRMPLFTKKSNEGGRFEISKNKTVHILK